MSSRRRPRGAVREFFRVYPTLLRIGLAEAVAYRAEFVVWMLTMSMPLVMLAVWSAVARDAPVGAFDQPAFVAYYLGTLIVRQLSGSWVVWELTRAIREGTLSTKLIRPLNPLVSYSAESLGAIPLRAVVVVPVALVAFALTHGSYHPRGLVGALIFVGAIAGAWLLNYCVMAFIGTLGLYLESAISIFDLWLGLFAVLSGYLVPLSLFPEWVQRFAAYTPFPYLIGLPVEILTGLRSNEDALLGLAAQWAYAGLAWIAMVALWRRALGRFQAFGG